MNTRNDLRPRGARHAGAKLNDDAVMEIRRLYHGEGYTMAKLAEINGVTAKTIANVLHGVTWGHVPERAS